MNPNEGAVMRIVGLARGGSHPADGMWLARYDPKRPPVPIGACAEGQISSEHCEMVLTPHREQAMAVPAHVLMKLWRTSCPCGTPQPSGRVCRPLSAFTVTIEALR